MARGHRQQWAEPFPVHTWRLSNRVRLWCLECQIKPWIGAKANAEQFARLREAWKLEQARTEAAERDGRRDAGHGQGDESGAVNEAGRHLVEAAKDELVVVARSGKGQVKRTRAEWAKLTQRRRADSFKAFDELVAVGFFVSDGAGRFWADRDLLLWSELVAA